MSRSPGSELGVATVGVWGKIEYKMTEDSHYLVWKGWTHEERVPKTLAWSVSQLSVVKDRAN